MRFSFDCVRAVQAEQAAETNKPSHVTYRLPEQAFFATAERFVHGPQSECQVEIQLIGFFRSLPRCVRAMAGCRALRTEGPK